MSNLLRLIKKSPKGPWVMLTAYDALMATQAEMGGVDLILVGDSLGTAILGYECVSQVSLQDMIHHGRAVIRGRESIPVIVDMPYNTYPNPKLAKESALKIMEIGCDAVKLEGCCPEVIRHLVSSDIPVFAHLGFTPQSAKPSEGIVVGKNILAAKKLLAEAESVCEAGALGLVLECVPREVAQVVAKKLPIPVIGIGSGPDVDGQVLVITDMWGDSSSRFKFLKRYAELSKNKVAAVEGYCQEVREGIFPSDENSFHINKKEKEQWIIINKVSEA